MMAQTEHPFTNRVTSWATNTFPLVRRFTARLPEPGIQKEVGTYVLPSGTPGGAGSSMVVAGVSSLRDQMIHIFLEGAQVPVRQIQGRVSGFRIEHRLSYSYGPDGVMFQ